MWILQYVDDISLACDTAEKLRVAVTAVDATYVGRNAAAQAADIVIPLRGVQLEVVSDLKDLGSVFHL